MDATGMGPVKVTGEKIVYGGLDGQFTGIHIVNLLLTLVTAGIFRFWARTRERRYVWGHTAVLGDWFEYTGTGRELFFGFLKALVVIAAIFCLFFAAGFVASFLGEDEGEVQLYSTVLSLPIYVLLAYLTSFATFSARRYRMSRTVWRGIRFEQQGSPVTYANRALGGLLLCIVTLGFYYPYYAMRLAAYEIGNLRFGTLAFRFDGDPRALWRPFLIAWAIGMAFLAVMAALFGGAIWALVQAGDDETALAAVLPTLALLPLAYLAAFIVLPLAWSGLRAAMLRHVAERTTLGGLRFSCDASGGRLFRLWFGNWLLLAVSFSLLRAMTVNRAMRFFARHYTIDGEIDLAAIAAAPAGPKSGEGLAGYFDLDALPG
jgi:uncharacterized membrane protein YjgN (DUF898 family)